MDAMPQTSSATAEETLDPLDWADMQALSHRIVDDAVGYLRDVRDRPVWREMPGEVRAFFDAPLPRSPAPIAEIYGDVARNVMAYPMGNIHPRFWSWYMGSSNFTGALGDFLAAIQGSNLGGGNHAAGLMDSQVVDWCKQMVGFPASASGTLVSGGSMANIIGLTVARNAKAGIDVREHGVGAIAQPLRFYGSDQTHFCHRKAMEVLGLGNRALRRIPSDAEMRIDIAALRAAIAEDRKAGFKPACIIGNAGTVNTGAIDDLQALAELAADEDLWFHVDGCIGALIAIAPENAAASQASSVPIRLRSTRTNGCTRRSRRAARWSAMPRRIAAPLPSRRNIWNCTPRGLASGHWLHEYGLQTSRGFRALKVWMALKEHGIEKFGRLIDQNIAQAKYLASLIEAEPALN